MSSNKENLLLLFDRPLEPIFMPKGKTSTVFDVPEKFFTDRYRPIANELREARSNEAFVRIPIRDISTPDLTVAMSLERDEEFSLFIPKHREIAGSLIDVFMGVSSSDDLLSVAAYARDRVNPYLFNYALSVALLHRPDTKDLDLPSHVQKFPDKFLESKVMQRIREEAAIVPAELRQAVIYKPLPETGSDLDPEHRLWYFREDLGANSHHWHWHLVYPSGAKDRSIVDKDRRGELFYYMHEQLLARYNMERLSNNLSSVVKLDNLRDTIKEGYCPKMYSSVAGHAWPSRYQNAQIKDLKRQKDKLFLEVGDLERWRDRIIDAIEMDYAVDKQGQHKPLDETTGIDTLGNMVEASMLSPNKDFYGDFHNMGHVILSYVHDPDDRFLESFGVMGEFATAMRDPVFYRWHAYINDIFQRHKRRLAPYTVPQLQYDGVSVDGVEVKSNDGQKNILSTFWQLMDIELSTGIDFVSRGNIFIQFNRLQHTPFTYIINVNNNSEVKRLGTVRIFMAPKYDDRGQTMLFNEQRHLMVELDKFVETLNPGKNTIERHSKDSSVTIPFEDTLHKRSAENSSSEKDFCSCGWPQNLLIAKGMPQGLVCELFVMVSNWEDDRVEKEQQQQQQKQLEADCKKAPSYCGLRNKRYPDKRAMGFPFDRSSRSPPNGQDTNLANFLTPNMTVIEVTIRHDPTKVIKTEKSSTKS